MIKTIKFLFFACFLAALSGCKGDYTDVSNDSKYKMFNSVIGKEFRTKVPMYVIKVDPETDYVSTYTRGEVGIPGIEDVKDFPYHSGGEVVHGILPVGSTYRVTKSIQRNSSTMGGVDWRAVITSSGPFQGWTIRTINVVSPEVFGPNFTYENVEETESRK